ncbi:MAG: RsmE family RNA methyltransferase [Deltaproteobacteria bacterium]
MTRRRLHVPPERIEGAVARPDAPSLHYLAGVLRLAPGAPVEVFDGAGSAWDATFDGETLRLGERRPAPLPGATVWLAFALARGEKGDWIVQKGTELGLSRIVPWQGERSVVRLEPGRASERARRWERIAAEAARQCGRSDVPEVAVPGTLAAALTAPPGFVRLVFHAGAGAPIASVVSPAAPGYLAVVGPEGGLTDREVDACLSAGCALASLGPRVLRAETAAVTAAALLQFLAGDLA